MTTRLTILLRMLGVALLAVLLLATPAMAQDDNDDDDDGHQHSTETMTDDDDDDRDGDHHGTATAGSNDDSFGAFIRAGTCEAPGDVVEDIGDLENDEDDAWRVIGGDDPAPEVVYDEDEDIGQTIDELTGGEFVVTIHERENPDSTMIACGAITGEVDADGTLLIDLDEVDDSGFEGRAHFGPDDADADDDHDDDDHDDKGNADQTEVTVGVWEVAPAGGV